MSYSPFVGAVAALEETISESANFQTWTGSDDATEALARIHRWQIDEADNLLAERPLAIIQDIQGERSSIYADDSEHEAVGTLLVVFEGVVAKAPGAAVLTSADIDQFETDLSGIVADLQAANAKAFFRITSVNRGKRATNAERQGSDDGDVLLFIYCPLQINYSTHGRTR